GGAPCLGGAGARPPADGAPLRGAPSGLTECSAPELGADAATMRRKSRAGVEFFGRAPGAGCHGAAASLCSALPQQAAFEREDGVLKKNLWKTPLTCAMALA